MTPPMTMPAGWYPDPDGFGGQRYWNGESWTDHRTPAAAAQPKSAGPDKKALIGVGVGVLVLIVVAVVAVVLTMKNDVGGPPTITHVPNQASGSSQTSTDDPDPTEPQASGTGEVVRDGNFSFVVNGVETKSVLVDPNFPEMTITADGEYVVVDVTVTNVSSEPQTFLSSFGKLSDGTTVFEADEDAWLYLDSSLLDIPPGKSAEAQIAYDVPKGTDLESIELHDGPFSDGVKVAL